MTLEVLYDPSDEQLYIDAATGMKSTYEEDTYSNAVWAWTIIDVEEGKENLI